MLTITNPADGSTITQLPEDTAESVATKYRAARAAQPAWAAVALAEKLGMMRRFREGVVRDLEKLAAVETSEVGKPLQQSKN